MNRSRRKFIQTATGTALASPWIGWKSTASGGPPSGELRFANFGAGGRAWSDLTEMMQVPNTSLVAVAEVDSGRLGKWHETYPGTKVYEDWRKLLDEIAGEIDAVVIGTPDHMHALIAMSAMQLGKHVYCEKPLTRTLHEARVLRTYAAEKGLMTQMGIQVASSSGNRTALKLLRRTHRKSEGSPQHKPEIVGSNVPPSRLRRGPAAGFALRPVDQSRKNAEISPPRISSRPAAEAHRLMEPAPSETWAAASTTPGSWDCINPALSKSPPSDPLPSMPTAGR